MKIFSKVTLFDKTTTIKTLLRMVGFLVAALFVSSCGEDVDCRPPSFYYQKTFTEITNPYHFAKYSSYEGITWRNITTGQSGTGTFSGPYVPGFCMFLCQDQWLNEADIWLTGGMNHVEISIGGSCPRIIYDYVITYIPTFPEPPGGLVAESADGQIILTWNNVTNAEFYNIYWANEPNVTKETGTKIESVTSPYTHSGLTNGVPYYYILTSQNSNEEGPASEEISAVPGAPSPPTGVNAVVVDDTIMISWNAVANTMSYNIYWSNEPGVTKSTGTKVEAVNSPYTFYELTGIPYYYIVTAVNEYGESAASSEVSGFPPFPPPSPTIFSVEQQLSYFWDLNFGYLREVDIEWSSVPGITSYGLFRCRASYTSTPEEGCKAHSCIEYWQVVYSAYSESETSYTDYPEEVGVYMYYVRAHNNFGQSDSDPVGICMEPVE